LRLQGSDISDAIDNAMFIKECERQKYPVCVGAPGFVSSDNYADNVGIHCKKFSKTDLDSHSGQPVFADRFWSATGWNSADMKRKWLLNVGCGSCRFAEVALSSGVNAVALDYSSVVGACCANLRHRANLQVVPGDIFVLPFAPVSFGFVYSLGVPQHTPDVHAAVVAFLPMLKLGVMVAEDDYDTLLILSKYLLRPITKRMDKKKLFALLEKVVPVLLQTSQLLGKVPLISYSLTGSILVANDGDSLMLTPFQYSEWSLLDTFDWRGLEYNNPHERATARLRMEEPGLRDIELSYAGNLVARGQH
jgi:hypothetical protein